MDYERWILLAIEKINELPHGHFFVLKDLFDGIQWSTLQRGQKLHFGRHFKNEVSKGRIGNVNIIPSSTGKPNTYQKI